MSKTLGQIGYDRYLASGPNPGRTFNNLPMPTWEELDLTEAGRITSARWEKAGEDIAGEVLLNGVPAANLDQVMARYRQRSDPPAPDSETEQNPIREPWGPAR